MLKSLSLCLVTHPGNASINDYHQLISSAVAGGITSVQLRHKTADNNTLLAFARAIKNWLQPHAIPLIINDNLAVAIAVDAEGIHLGQVDGSPTEARKALGPNKLIGLSIDSWDNLEEANAQSSIDYIGVTVFKSSTKTNCKTLWGLDGLRDVVTYSKHPVVAIGGITLQNARQVKDAGVCGIAVISAIHNQPSPKEAARNLILAMEKTDV